MIEIICNEIYQKAPNSIYRLNNEARVIEQGLLCPALSVASPFACPVEIEIEYLVGDGYDDRYGEYDVTEYKNIAKECEKYGWYNNAQTF